MAQVLVRSSAYSVVEKTIDGIFEAFGPDIRGKRVLIKPNSLNEREPESGANTHPSVLSAVIKAARAAGAADVMVGDNPGQANYGRSRSVFRQNGLGDAAGTALVSLSTGLVVRRVPAVGQDLYFPRLLFEVDYLINLPKLKVHPGTGLTGAVKNTFGCLPGAQKAYCHVAARDRRTFECALADVYRLRPPDLNIMDGVLASAGRAAGGPSLRYPGKLVASRSAAAVDVLAASMLGIWPENLYHVAEIAHDEAIDLDVTNLDVSGEWSVAGDMGVPPGFRRGERRPNDGPNASLFESASRKTLELDPALCDACGECARQCPTRALLMDQGRPQVESGACVSCFACVEACRRNAIDLAPNPTSISC
jgi:uncharacterized protein (DUF362 family)/ferredoxin